VSEVFIDGIRYVPAREPDAVKKSLPSLLRDARLLREETLDYVSDKTGLAKSSLHALEKGTQSPRLETLQSLLSYYQINFDEIK